MGDAYLMKVGWKCKVSEMILKYIVLIDVGLMVMSKFFQSFVL